MKINTSESGRSMVEMLGVIAIIGVISVGGITSMSYVDSYFRTNSTLLEVDQLSRDVIDMCSWARDFSECGLTTYFLKEEGVLDSDKNRWGGNITVESTDNSFTITYTNVPESVCEQMVEETKEKHPMQAKGSCNGTGNVTFVERDFSDD